MNKIILTILLLPCFFQAGLGQSSSIDATVYQIPKASPENRIELNIENLGKHTSYNVDVFAVDVPDWINLLTEKVSLGEVGDHTESVAVFDFSVDSNAPVGIQAPIKFEIKNRESILGEKEILLEFMPIQEVVLEQNYPNPFNPETNINFALPVNSDVEIIVYDTIGREVVKLVEDEFKAGYHSIKWNATSISSGTYFYVLKVVNSGAVETLKSQKMVLIK